MKKLTYILLTALLVAPSLALAVNISVPQSTGYGQLLVGNAAGGSYTPTATSSTNFFSITTTGSSGAATYAGGVLNIPQYSGGSSFSTTSANWWASLGLAHSTTSANYNSNVFLAATTSVKSIITLPSLSLPYSQLTGTPTSLPTSTLLGDSNTFSGTLNKFTNAPALAITGLIKGNGSSAITAGVNGTDFTLITAKTCTGSDFVSSVTAAGVFTCTTPVGTTYTGTYPVVVTGSVISSGFGTTTTWGLGNNGLVVTGPTGIPFIAASSSLSLPNAALQNSSITLNGSAVSLGGSAIISSTTLLANFNTFTGQNMFLASTTIGGGTSVTGLTISGNATTSGQSFLNGNVGIFKQPTVSLDVLGGGTNQTVASFSGSNSNNSNLMLINTGTGGRSYSFIATANGNSIGGGKFVINDNVNGSRLIIDSNGLVSIPANASTSQLSTGKLYVGATATTSIDGTGNVVIPSGSNLTITGKSDGCATFASGVLNSTGSACGSGGSGASTTLLSDTNTFSGPVKFSNTLTAGSNFFTNNVESTAGDLFFEADSGKVIIQEGPNFFNATLDSATNLTDNRNFAFPDESGTLALGTGSAGNCASWSTTNTLTTTGSPCGSGGGGTFAWTPTTNFGATANATSTPIWFKQGLQSSSTVNISGNLNVVGENVNFGSSSTSGYNCNGSGAPCIQFIGNDNTDNGVTFNLQNKNAGDHASTNYLLTNDLTGNNPLTYYGVLGLNSSVYNNNDFGTIFNVPNQVYLQSSNGPVTIDSSGGSTNGYISFATNGSAMTNEAMRINVDQDVLIGSTTDDGSIWPGQDSRLQVMGDTENIISAYADLNDFAQINCLNKNAGNNAQCGFSATRNDGNLTGNFIWMGVNNTGFWNPTAFNVGGPGDGTILSDLNDLFVAQGTTGRKTHFLNGGVSTSTNEVMTFATTSNSTNVVGIGTTSPFANLSIQALGGHSTTTTLFAIGSSSTQAGANTTLFSVGNTGLITTQLGSGFVKSTGAGSALSIDTNTYLTGNQTITLSGVVTGSGATSITTSFASANANTVLANATGASAAPTFVATSTFFGTGSPGSVLSWLNGVPTWSASSSVAAGTGIAISASGAVTTVSLASMAAGVLGTAATGVPTSQATSTLYGAAQNGKVLGYSGGLLVPLATSTNSCSGVTCVYSNGVNTFSIANNAITLAMLPTLGAGQIWANNTSATGNAVAIATSTLFGTGAPGTVLSWLNGVPTWSASSSVAAGAGLTVTTSGAVNTVSIGNNALTLSMFPTIAANTIIGNVTGGTATPTAFATSSLFAGTTGQAAWFSGTGQLTGTSSLTFTAASSTLLSDLLIKKTSPTALAIQDGFGTNLFLVNTASTTGSIFTVVATTSPISGTGVVKLFDVDQYGHTLASSTQIVTLSGCGTSPTLKVGSSDDAGEVTLGTTATGCTITFGTPYTSAPICVVTDQSQLVSFAYTISTAAITITQTSTSNNKIDYMCEGQ